MGGFSLGINAEKQNIITSKRTPQQYRDKLVIRAFQLYMLIGYNLAGCLFILFVSYCFPGSSATDLPQPKSRYNTR